MNTHADKAPANQGHAVANLQQSLDAGMQLSEFADNSPEAMRQRKLKDLISNSPQVKQLAAWKSALNGYAIAPYAENKAITPSQHKSQATQKNEDDLVAGYHDRSLPWPTLVTNQDIHAVERKPARPKPPLQLKNGVYATSAPIQLLVVDGKRITKGGETGKWLLGELVRHLLKMRCSPHGLTKHFKDTIAAENGSYTLAQYLQLFEARAVKEVARVNAIKEARKASGKKGGERIRSWTRVFKLNRPAWTKPHKEMASAGQDIRHIVRNATMKKAIVAEYEVQKKINDGQAFTKIAQSLNINPGRHSVEAMRNIYNEAFLNKLNLFSGGGGVNRVIGLSADRLISFGEGVSERKGVATADDVTKIYLLVDNLIQAQIESTAKQGSELKAGSDNFAAGMEDFYEEITNFLDDAYAQWLEAANSQPVATADDDQKAGTTDDEQELVDNTAAAGAGAGAMISDEQDVKKPAASGGASGTTAMVQDEEDSNSLFKMIGNEIIDIGLNFGFDMPATPNPQLLQKLLYVEEALGNYKPGNPDKLREILAIFLKPQ